MPTAVDNLRVAERAEEHGRPGLTAIPEDLAPPFLEAFAALEAEGVPYCVLRIPAKAGVCRLQEVDVLFASGERARVQRILGGKGFSPIPGWGHAPHHFFVAYDAAHDTWLKLDLVGDLRYGNPIRSLRTGWAEDCLRSRRRQGTVFVAAPEYAFLKQVLHFLLDDESGFFPERQSKLADLFAGFRWDQAAAERAAALVDRHFAPVLTWSWILQAVSSAQWEGFAARRAALKRRLFWREPLGNLWREFSGRLMRSLRPLLFALFHRGFAVALLAPDGAGKTTLAQALARDEFLKVRVIYMGANPARRTLPLPSWAFAAAHSGAGRNRLSRAIRFTARIAEQWARSLMAWYHLLRGRVVIFDRFPTESRLHFEAPTIGRRLRRFLLELGCPRPDLVCLLDAPPEVLLQRKPEHTLEWLERQRHAYLRLRRHLPGAIVVDATPGSRAVKAKILAQVWKQFSELRRPA